MPGLFGGSNKKSEEHLRKSLTYAPQSTASHFFLAETLFDLDRDDEARAELQRVLDAPIQPGWEPEDREFKAKASQRLGRQAPKVQDPNPKALPTPKGQLNGQAPNQPAPWKLGWELEVGSPLALGSW